jgi:DNA-binding winged helix-turn-helix (wHTH) protein/Tol biopolymer transport system component
MNSSNFRYYEFGEFKLDLRRRNLTKNNGEIPISAKNFDLLLELIKNEGRILSHDELLDSVWAGTFVEQSNLKKGISAIRHILGETPESSLFIKTIPRKGYSFVGQVRALAEEPEGDGRQLTRTEVIIEEEIIDDGEPQQTVKVLPASNQAPTFWQKYQKLLLAVIVLLFLGLMAFSFRGYFSKKGKRFSVENVRITKLTNDGNCHDASISADGNFILCGKITKDGNTLITRQISANSQVQLLPTQKDVSFWAFRLTPDGNSVYYIINDKKDSSQSGLFQIPFLGGIPRKIVRAANASVIFSPDSQQMVYVRIEQNSNKIILTDLNGANEKILAEYGFGYRIWGLSWSPDGKSILCSARLQTEEKFTGFVDEISISDGTKSVVFPPQEKMVTNATWMPDKSSILLAMREVNSEIRQIWQYFPYSKELFRVTNDNNTYRFPTLNQAGTIISVSQESLPSGIYVGDLNSKEVKSLTSENGSYNAISWTNDNHLIYNSFEEGSEAIWSMNPDGSNKRQITGGNDGIGIYPRLSNSGNSVVFPSMRTGTKTLWRVNIDGTEPTQLTQNELEQPLEGKLLSDNKTLIGVSITQKGNFLWRRAENGEKTEISGSYFGGWDVSQDDKLVLLDTFNDLTRKDEIIVQSLETGEVIYRYEINPDRILRWIDSNSFVYAIKQDEKTTIYRQTLGKNSPEIIYQYTGQFNETIYSISFSPDKKYFAFVRGRDLTDAVTIKIDESK